MPTYEAYCKDCEISADYSRTIDQRMDTPVCISCGKKMDKVVFSAPTGFVTGKFEAFQSTVDGSIISNRRELDEHNRRNDVVNVADGWDEETIRRGDYIAPEKADINDIKQDIAEATSMVAAGYKPIVEVSDE